MPLWPASLLLLAAAVMAVLRRVPQVLEGHDLFSDDAYYYLVIARNFVESGRFTFDGVTETHGFHPLLFWLQTAAFYLLGTDGTPMQHYLAAAVGFGAVFLLTIVGALLAAHAPLRSKAERLARPILLLALAGLLIPRFSKPYLIGMESTLVLPLLLWMGTAAWWRRYDWAGVAGLLLVMARLDMLPFVVLPLALVCAFRERHSRVGSGPILFQVALPGVLGVAALVAWHQWYFGHPMPISGVLKSTFPLVHFQWEQHLLSPSRRAALLVAAGGSVVGLVLVAWRGRLDGNARGLGATAALLALIQLAALALFQKWSKPLPLWYLGPAVLFGLLAFSAGVGNVLSRSRLHVLTLLAAIAALGANLVPVLLQWPADFRPWAGVQLPTEPTGGLSLELVEFMKTKPPEQRWACTDCGKLAFWSRRPVVNLDGLVNDFEYQKALRDRRLEEYLREKHVRYLIFLAWDRPQSTCAEPEPMYHYRFAPDVFSGDYRWADFYLVSYQYLRYSERVRLPRSAEIWRSPPYRDGRLKGRDVVFDLSLCRQDATEE